MSVESVLAKVPGHPGVDGTSESWVQWTIQRLQMEPWALGGAVVIGLFLLMILALVVFALIYGCCCSPKGGKRRINNGVL
ncbi:hypothetical protein DPEC_G00331010 [Dallia pectoralis]|uniref:Uncharacterized protein n=1 Tax=Dallia pectoralis TaxID=75939 RepID=A0ACC2F937_DALPE|nr:hypothetical protein DPEC_G00331010 [Dallia pectoralis]